jgi:hypothetical protein
MFVITLKTLSTVIGTVAILATSAISVKANPLYVSTSNGEVGSVDEATGAYTPLLNSLGFTDIALDSAGDLWGITFSNLYSIDLTSKTTNLIGGLGVGGMNGLGFSSDGNLYGTGGNGFYSIDINTGAASQIASVLGFSSSGDIEYDATRGLFWATSSGDSLWTISKDGIANKVGNIGYSSVYGLAFGQDNTLFGYTTSGQQIALDLDTGSGTFVKNITGMDSCCSAGVLWGSASHSRNVALPTVPTESTPEPSSLLGLATLGVFMLRRKYR